MQLLDVELSLTISRRKLQYLVAWKGLDESENSWEPAEKINVPELQREFHRRYPHKPKPQNWHLQEIFEETDSEEEEFIGFGPSETEEIAPSIPYRPVPARGPLSSKDLTSTGSHVTIQPQLPDIWSVCLGPSQDGHPSKDSWVSSAY
uniref:Chromo domain-containing protein n=1 Tax=Podarcis muralis TaxID=64176 RepID=A0A670KB13_PODMU